MLFCVYSYPLFKIDVQGESLKIGFISWIEILWAIDIIWIFAFTILHTNVQSNEIDVSIAMLEMPIPISAWYVTASIMETDLCPVAC